MHIHLGDGFLKFLPYPTRSHRQLLWMCFCLRTKTERGVRDDGEGTCRVASPSDGNLHSPYCVVHWSAKCSSEIIPVESICEPPTLLTLPRTDAAPPPLLIVDAQWMHNNSRSRSRWMQQGCRCRGCVQFNIYNAWPHRICSIIVKHLRNALFHCGSLFVCTHQREKEGWWSWLCWGIMQKWHYSIQTNFEN